MYPLIPKEQNHEQAWKMVELVVRGRAGLGGWIGCDGMGPYRALGFYGFDNVSQQFVSSFMDNHSTGISRGVGQLSDDGKVLTWEYTFNCPITKEPTVLREVLTTTGENTRAWEFFGKDPKSGKEYQMMKIEMERK